MEAQSDGGMPSSIEVFWRPGCPYCRALRGLLHDYEVEATWRNIWSDDEARALVRAANNGNETVPTVRVGGVMLTNPTWRQLAQALGRDHREPPRPIPPRPYASAGSCVVAGAERESSPLTPEMLLTAGVVVLVDLVAKTWAEGHLADGRQLSWGPLTLQLVHNSGLGYGIGAGSPGPVAAISVLGLALLLIMFSKTSGRAARTALAVAIAGGIANLVDRLGSGTVTDWIHVAGYPLTFNIADIAVRGGLLAALLAFAWPRRSRSRFRKRAYRTAGGNLEG